MCIAQPNQTYTGAVCPKKDNSTYEYLLGERVLRNLEGQRKRKISQQGEEEKVREAQVVQNSASPGSMSIPLHTVQNYPHDKTFQTESTFLPSLSNVKSVSLSHTHTCILVFVTLSTVLLLFSVQISLSELSDLGQITIY